MDAVAVLVLSEDAKARAILAALDGIASYVPAETADHPCDVAFCSSAKLRPALAKAAADLPALALGVDIPADAAPAFIAHALRGAVTIARAQSALAASLDELEQQRSALMQSNALKNDLIATLAHDIKGPLTSIVGFAELMEEGFLEGADATDAARTIRSNAQRLAALANDILALSRVDHGELEIADDRVNLRDVLTQCVQAALAERTIEYEIEPDGAFVRGDAERLRQVFDNLLRNAIKYSPGGEPVRVEVRADGNTYAVRVIDRGIGIPPDEMSKLFQRFGRASNARKSKIAGTGVGLFIVKTIVERHGGTVTVQSVVGAGSVFAVTLPAMDTEQRIMPPRIVVVTPDARLRRFTAYELRARGFRVLELETLDAAHKQVKAGDVALVDGDLGTSLRARVLLPTAERIIGLGAGDTNGWDATLSKPYLVTDLVAVLMTKELV